MKFLIQYIVISILTISPSFCWAQGKVTRNTSTTNQALNRVKNTKGFENGYEWVDLGLPSGIKWATCNVGASSPDGIGNYYAWGEIRPKSDYGWYNCFDCMDRDGERWNLYKIGGRTQILPTSGHDAANENWGGRWRMPTEAECKELVDKCKWSWIQKDYYSGYNVTGPNGNSIFLPANGWRGGDGAQLVGKHGSYWSSTLIPHNKQDYSKYFSEGNGAYSLTFDDGTLGIGGDCSYRKFGRSVRPVTE